MWGGASSIDFRMTVQRCRCLESSFRREYLAHADSLAYLFNRSSIALNFPIGIFAQYLRVDRALGIEATAMTDTKLDRHHHAIDPQSDPPT